MNDCTSSGKPAEFGEDAPVGDNATLYERLSGWYRRYAESFCNGDRQLTDAVRLKQDHTRRVVQEVRDLCESLGLDRRRTSLASIAALFHDVARFEQFKRFRTFADNRSVNHAELGISILGEARLLDALAPVDAQAIACAIRHHNAAAVPGGLDDEGLLLCRLLRDADKIDIYRVVVEYDATSDPARNEIVRLGIPEGVRVTPEVCARVLRREPVPYDMVSTIADFQLIQLGWVFDLNFSHSLRRVKERRYIAAIANRLPSTPEVRRVVEAVESHLEKMAAQPFSI